MFHDNLESILHQTLPMAILGSQILMGVVQKDDFLINWTQKKN
jgi:hypothetical protein